MDKDAKELLRQLKPKRRRIMPSGQAILDEQPKATTKASSKAKTAE